MTDHILYTIGYEKRSQAEYLELLQAASVTTLIDVREIAWSRKTGFSGGQLAKGLATAGIEYIHAKFAGNPKAIRKDIVDHAEILARYRAHVLAHPGILVELFQLIADQHALGKRVALSCFERHPDDCHRGALAEWWADFTQFTVEHLGPDGCERKVNPPVASPSSG